MTRALPVVLPTLLSCLCPPAGAQVSVGPGGVRAGSTVVDSTGVHTGRTDVTARGVSTRAGGGRGAGTVIRTNGGDRRVDCAGGRLTVDGNNNRVSAVGCAAIALNGNGNTLSADFPAPGRLTVLGNRNRVTWHAGPRVRVGVSNLGNRNSVARR